jgi:branched-chain amino acid transport system ATP-binding protein
VIEIENLTVRYGGVTSLDGLSLTLEKGICGLIGPNGAGKTTFFNVLSGFVRPASGSVRAFGDNLLGMTHFRRARWGVRRTFQTEQAISDLTVYDNVAMIHSQLRGAARRADIMESIAFVGGGVDPYAKVGSLTAGQRRLVEVARAVAGKPRLLLLDEPAAGLDVAGREQLLASVDDLSGRQPGLASVLVTHHLEELPASTTHAMLLRDGRILAAGPADEVLTTELVSACFGHPVAVSRHAGRWAAVAVR